MMACREDVGGAYWQVEEVFSFNNNRGWVVCLLPRVFRVSVHEHLLKMRGGTSEMMPASVLHIHDNTIEVDIATKLREPEIKLR